MRAPVALALAAWAMAAAACGSPHDAPVLAKEKTAVAPAQTPPSSSAIPHGDHNPKYGGVVYMNGDLHFEVVLRRDGRHQIYFSDATRAELPAATASGLTLTVTQKGQPPEPVPMRIDDSGESWIGSGHAVEDPAATVRVAYTAFDKPYFIDVPFPRESR
jgi:hypothetical protein